MELVDVIEAKQNPLQNQNPLSSHYKMCRFALILNVYNLYRLKLRIKYRSNIEFAETFDICVTYNLYGVYRMLI